MLNAYNEYIISRQHMYRNRSNYRNTTYNIIMLYTNKWCSFISKSLKFSFPYIQKVYKPNISPITLLTLQTLNTTPQSEGMRTVCKKIIDIFSCKQQIPAVLSQKFYVGSPDKFDESFTTCKRSYNIFCSQSLQNIFTLHAKQTPKYLYT